MTETTTAAMAMPDTEISVEEVFGFKSDLKVPAFSTPSEHVPEQDPDYLVRPGNHPGDSWQVLPITAA